MMDHLASFHFIRPWTLVVLPLIGGVWWYWQESIDPLRGWRQRMGNEFLRALVVDTEPANKVSPLIVLCGWILSAIAIAGPTWKLEPSPFAQDAQPLIILLKAAESMQTADATTSKLQLAQLKIRDLADARNGDPLGLIAYAGSAHLVLPPTEDTSVVAEMAAEIDPTIMPVAGDQLDKAIESGGRRLQESENGGSLLVIADQAEIAPSVVQKAAQSVGSPRIQILNLAEPETVESQSLQEIATVLGGQIQNISVDDSDIDAIVDFANRRPTGGVAGESQRWQEAGYWLTPILTVLVAMSFRRQAVSKMEATK